MSRQQLPREHGVAGIYGSVVITCDLLICPLPCAFTYTHKYPHTHAVLKLPMMDDEVPVPGIDDSNPGVGELGIDGQDDVELSRHEPTFTAGQCSV